ncbi:Hypothetical predicted protein, partial [Paramuricea clavata]
MKYMPRLKRDEVGVSVCPYHLFTCPRRQSQKRRKEIFAIFHAKYGESSTQSSGETSQVTDPENIDQEHPDVMEMDMQVDIETAPITMKGDRAYVNDYNMRTEPKFILCLSQLMLLFQICPLCRSPNPLVDVQHCGTMAKVVTTCPNQGCGSNVWDSQPNMVGTKIPAGNFLLSFAILVA